MNKHIYSREIKIRSPYDREKTLSKTWQRRSSISKRPHSLDITVKKNPEKFDFLTPNIVSEKNTQQREESVIELSDRAKACEFEWLNFKATMHYEQDIQNLK